MTTAEFIQLSLQDQEKLPEAYRFPKEVYDAETKTITLTLPKIIWAKLELDAIGSAIEAGKNPLDQDGNFWGVIEQLAIDHVGTEILREACRSDLTAITSYALQAYLKTKNLKESFANIAAGAVPAFSGLFVPRCDTLASMLKEEESIDTCPPTCANIRSCASITLLILELDRFVNSPQERETVITSPVNINSNYQGRH